MAKTRILGVLYPNLFMQFAIVTSSISALLIAVVSAISITVLSWMHPTLHSIDPATEMSTEISWGQGS